MIHVYTNSIAKHINTDVILQARVLNIQKMRSQHNGDYYQLRLADWFGETIGYAWSGCTAFDLIETIDAQDMPCIEVSGRVNRLNQQSSIRITSLYLINAAHTQNGALLIPRAATPKAAINAMSWLVQFMDAMDNDALRDFLSSILLDPDIGIPFVKSRASDNNHHAYPGGLLVHSVEVARLVEINGHQLGLSDDEILITQVAALIHDLGKVNTVGGSNPRPMPTKLFRHEVQTIHLISPYLQKLNQTAPVQVWILTHLLDRFIGSKGTYHSQFIGEDLVHYADCLSAANGVRKGLSDFIKQGHYCSKHPNNGQAHDPMYLEFSA